MSEPLRDWSVQTEIKKTSKLRYCPFACVALHKMTIAMPCVVRLIALPSINNHG